ncbi:MAG: hypothetical protein P8P30_02400 [Rickettsiales bacterium]|nr:hypothetical protein [Rickettsiales bacterium]
MEPEDFARQFFDIWQDSFSNAMEESSLNSKLLHLMEQSNDLWHSSTKKTETHAVSNGTPYQQSSKPDEHSERSVQELASRLEKCEQRIHVLETIIRGEFGKAPDTRKSYPEGERNARIKVSKGTG